jgi:hypothetical protein
MKKRKVEIDKDKILEESKVISPIEYNMDGVSRINAIPDYNKTLSKDFLENIITKFFVMTPEQIKDASNDKTITIIERMVLTQVVEAINAKSKNSLSQAKYLQERVSGLARERIEHTGANGSPLMLVKEKEENIDSMLEDMSDKELEAYEKAVKLISKIKTNHAKK